MSEPVQKMCRKKLHRLTPDNLTADGRGCRACRRKTQRDWVAAYRKTLAAQAVPGAPSPAQLQRSRATARELVQAAHHRDVRAVQRLVADCEDVDALVLVLARQLATAQRSLAGKGRR